MEITRMRELAITGIALQRERLDAELRELVAEQQAELREGKLLAASVVEEPRARISRLKKNGQPYTRWTRPAAPKGQRTCNKCGEVKALEDFPKNHSCKEGRAGTCKQCNHARINANYAARKARKSQAPPPPKRRTARQSIDPHTLKVAAPQDPGVTGEPLTCPFCHSPCSTPERYRSHLKKVHDKEVAA